ncbi:MAG TPA: AhpC/TSA family protein [Candidatus Dormibacteraeota bacterium]|nr:AhpC/TSA family protein [Candidatus Dormibacteraeota bacterium]
MRGIAKQAAKFGNLAIVGNGTVAHARDFDRTHSRGVLRSLVDTDKKTYQALTMKHGLNTTMTAAGGLRALAALSRGHTQTATKGDPNQQGGVLVLAAGGRPVFFQRSEFAGDHAKLEEILIALKQAAQL